jgi:hypothetical protein
MSFDIEGARRAGYSPAEIADHLAQGRNFDTAGARRSGYSDDEIINHLRAPLAQSERGTLETAANVAGQFGAGVNQRGAQVLGAIPDLYNRGLRAVGLPAMPEGAYTRGIQSGINSVVGDAPAPQGTLESLARGAGSGLVDAATFAVPAAGVARATVAGVGQAPSLINRAATAVAAQPVMQTTAGMVGGAVGEATDSPMAGFLASMAVPLGAAAVGRAITPIRAPVDPAHARLVRAAESEGIPVSAGQATGNRFLQNAEAVMEQLPLTSGPARAQIQAQQSAGTRAALRYAGTEADNAGPDVLNATQRRIGSVFNDLTARNNLRLDDEAMTALAAVENNLTQFTLPDVARPALNRLRQIVSAADEAGEVPGVVYRQMDSALSRQARETSNGDLRTALTEVRDALRAIMDRSISPQDSAAWQQARRQYANFANIREAMNRAGNTTARGQISMPTLQSIVNKSTGRGYAQGRGDLNTLSRIGQDVVREVKDSGTSGRTFATNALTLSGTGASGGMIGGMLGGPIGAVVGMGAGVLTPRLVQSLMSTPAGQAYLRNQVIQNPVLPGSLAAALAAQQGGAVVNRP